MKARTLRLRLHTTPCVSCREDRAEERGGLQGRDPERADDHHVRPDHAFPDQAGQKQRVTPDNEADQEAGTGAERRSARPDQSSDEGRGDLRDRREGEKADRRQRRVSGDPVIAVAHQENDQDREPAHHEHEPAPVGGLGRRSAFASTRRRSTIGRTRWFEIMIATATVSTITMAVAAESPPRNAMRAIPPAPSKAAAPAPSCRDRSAPLEKRQGPRARSEPRRC